MYRQPKIKNKIILRFLCCNLLILLVLSVIMIPYFSHLYKESRRQAYVHQEKLLTDCTASIIEELKSFEQYARFSRSNSYLAALAKEQEVRPETHYSLLKAQSYLNSTYFTSTYVRDFFFAFRDNDIYLSSNFCITLPRQDYGKHYGFINLDYDSFRKLIVSKTEPSFLSTQDVIFYEQNRPVQAIPYIIPVANPYISYPLNYDTFMICYLDISKITHLVTHMETELAYYYLTYNDQMIFASNPQNLPMDTSSELTSADNTFHLKLHAMVNQSVLSSDIKKASILFQTSILIATLLGVIFSIITAFYNGIPVIKLNQKIASLDSKILDNKHEILKYKNNETRFYFSRLISNSYQNYDASKLAELFPFLCIPYRILFCAFTYTTDNISLSKKDFLATFQNAFPDIIYSELTPPGNFLFILDNTYLETSDQFQRNLKDFSMNGLFSEFYYTCIVSETGTQIADFYSLYTKVERILRIRFEPSNNVFLSADSLKSDEKLPISVKALQALYQNLIDAHTQEAVTLIEGFYHTIHTGPILSEKYIRSAYFSIHNILAFVISDLHLPILIPVFQPTDTLYQGFSGLIKVAKEICFHTKKEKTEKVNNTIDSFFVYVKDNFKDPALSPAMIAQYLGFSEKYLFNYIKTNTGRTISSHILEIRMLYAANALLSQDKKVQEIAEESGFYTVNSFYKNFKKCFGDSPAVWRKNNLDKSSITELTFLP